MRDTFLPSPVGYDPYNSAVDGWVYDRSEYTLTQMKRWLMPQEAPPDMFFPTPPPKIMPEYPLL